MKYITEIMNEIRLAETEQEKINILKANQSPELVRMMEYAFTDKYSVDEIEIPKYKIDDSPVGFSYTSLSREYKNIPYFFESHTGIQKQKRDLKLKNLLESLYWMDSSVLENALLKKIDSFPVTLDLLQKAFPLNFK
jgi:hypothetical protein